MSDSTLKASGFLPGAPIAYRSKASGLDVSVSAQTVIEVIAQTNEYLFRLEDFFADADFDFYDVVGQRNLSGFIGEIFVKFFETTVDGFAANPHADGRPDLLDLTSEEAALYLERECFAPGKRSPVPLRGKLAPFKFGGIEVKTTIGDQISGKSRLKLFNELGVNGFSIGMPRIDFLSSITYWGHHTSCENLIGLYYDYVPDLEASPQLFMAMHAELEPKLDWTKVSVGRANSKKTSNTSLTKAGRQKLYRNVIAVTTEPRYLERLSLKGIHIPGRNALSSKANPTASLF